MRAWFAHHVACLSATLRGMVRAPFSSMINALVIGLAATLPLIGLVAIENGRALAGGVALDPTLGVFFALDAGKQEIDAVESVLRNTSGVRSVQFIARSEALERLRKIEGLGDTLGTLRSNPLPDTLVARLEASAIAPEGQLAAQVRAMPKVAHVQLDAAWMLRLRRLLELGGAALTLLSALLGAVFVGVTFNTVRAQIHGQADELAVARLVGATDRYLRRPFCHFGSWLGLLGGLIALGLTWAVLAYLDQPIADLAQAYGSSVRLVYPTLGQMGIVVGVSGLLGLLGAFMAVSIYLLKNPSPA